MCRHIIYDNEDSSCCGEINGTFRCDWLACFFDEYSQTFMNEPVEDTHILKFLYANIVPYLHSENHLFTLEIAPRYICALTNLKVFIQTEIEESDLFYAGWLHHYVEEYSRTLSVVMQ